jgi:hypothetical protein
MHGNEPHPDPVGAAALVPLAGADPKGDFSAYSPDFVDRAISLRKKFDSYYHGVVLFGRCPRCPHDDGINVFIPTTGATITVPGGLGAGPAQEVAAAPEAAGDMVRGWVSYTTESRYGANEFVEVIVCRCGQEHVHQPPSGRSGCGFWAYLHLPEETIRDDQSAH